MATVNQSKPLRIKVGITTVRLMFNGVLPLHMEKFSVRRGVQKEIGGNAGLAKLATEYFEQVSADSDGVFTASYGLLTKVTGYYDSDGKLVVDVNQLKGDDLTDFLSSDDGRKKAMESQKEMVWIPRHLDWLQRKTKRRQSQRRSKEILKSKICH